MTFENPFEGKTIWFGVGSQDLYGEEALRQVAEQSTKIVDALNATGKIPVKLVLKPTLKSSDGVKQFMTEASADPSCIGVIAWMHTFSPAKMWIRGLEVLTKPLLQLNTQFHKEIPWDTIDMDFMNLNQSAHGDREFGYIVTRLGIPRKIVVGHYTDPEVAEKISTWVRACAGWNESQNMRVMRWGDNMRNVAVTEGDKTEAERVFGTQVNTWAVNELVGYYEKVKDDQVKGIIEDYKAKYDVAPELLDSRYEELFIAAKEEAAMVNMMKDNGATAAVDNFEDLGTLPQLPGVGAQRLPSEYGYGFSAEGDWKTSVLVRIASVMGYGLEGGSSLMEDYSYNFVEGHEMDMGSHMLEVSPSVGTIAKPKLEIHPLGIGNKSDPVRLVFTVAPHKAATVISMADMRERFRLLMDVVDVVEPEGSLKALPCARGLWKPRPSLKTAAECWLRAGGSHHTCMTTSFGREGWEDFARIAGVELATIDENTTPREFERDLEISEMYHRLDNRC
ncbi:L-arabinose isomerase [Bifidobacterium sp. ESL0732]|uniref:L-arabinose isomerase n=1 Tax=Bifidobacterium sp. ESL0732 TaxID=2983222 RepID=UPI0023F9B3DA|nr:L-arabinose isomerase [Bifidobacterium sp. ESL0732]WEV64953.1 L-arabinose isomerase [Bifidobacterium sp. ESL0732]